MGQDHLRILLALGIVLAAAPARARAQCVVRSDAPVEVGVRLADSNGETTELVMERAHVEVTLQASAPWSVHARGPVTIEGALVPERTHFAIRRHRVVPGLVHAGVDLVHLVQVRVVHERSGRVDVDFDDGGRVRTLAGVPCDALAVVEPEVPVHHGVRGCAVSHEPVRTHARLRDGAAIARTPGGPIIARATSERSFEIWPAFEGWVAIVGVPGADPICPMPLGVVGVEDVLELDVYDRVGVRLRIDRASGRYVVLRVEGRAVASGVRRGDAIVSIGRSEPTAADGRAAHVAHALYESTAPIVVRRGRHTVALPPARDALAERRRRRGPDEPVFSDF